MKNQITMILASLLLLINFNSANAAMVSTTSLLQSGSNVNNNDALTTMRTELTEELVNFGVSPQDADMRVSALTDGQIISMNNQIASMPAGGDVLGLAVTVFIVLVVTDVLGATDIFPFIHPIN
jgi:hypothetical protein